MKAARLAALGACLALLLGMFDRLYSWTEGSDVGVKHFSGTATYGKTVKIRTQWLNEGRACNSISGG